MRLERYRARRKPRGPRYPSLRLPFDSWSSGDREQRNATTVAGALAAAEPVAPAITQNVAFQLEELSEPEVTRQSEFRAPAIVEYESSAKVIEFPRYAAIPVSQGQELAEPVLDRPRIVEAPEVVPPPPALGGILIEAPAPAPRPRSLEDQPRPASLIRRIAAGTLDALILLAALAGFGAIFYRLNPELAPIPLLAGAGAAVALILWAGYEYLFLVHTGSTPGLRILRLRLTKFDGSPVPRRLRRWRVLASYLSAFSLGLGYLWGTLDEDGLCWHDRITRTQTR